MVNVDCQYLVLSTTLRDMGWFNSVKSPKLKKYKKSTSNAPSGLWQKCKNCGEILQTSRLAENLQVCPYCQYHYRISAYERLMSLIDQGSFKEELQELQTSDPLDFTDKISYRERLQQSYEKHSRYDGTYVGTASIEGLPVSIAVMDFYYMGGSMGVITGEKIARCLTIAREKKIPAVVVNSSGGARMQEGILSLMQMAKTSAEISALKKAGGFYLSVLTDPTTGGCAASFAMLGDINIAEPEALIGFAGPRVIEQSIRQKLPDGFQRSEFLKNHGFIDQIIHRKDLKKEIAFYLKFCR